MVEMGIEVAHSSSVASSYSLLSLFVLPLVFRPLFDYKVCVIYIYNLCLVYSVNNCEEVVINSGAYIIIELLMNSFSGYKGLFNCRRRWISVTSADAPDRT